VVEWLVCLSVCLSVCLVSQVAVSIPGQQTAVLTEAVPERLKLRPGCFLPNSFQYIVLLRETFDPESEQAAGGDRKLHVGDPRDLGRPIIVWVRRMAYVKCVDSGYVCIQGFDR
jgi:hypothetical protein